MLFIYFYYFIFTFIIIIIIIIIIIFFLIRRYPENNNGLGLSMYICKLETCVLYKVIRSTTHLTNWQKRTDES